MLILLVFSFKMLWVTLFFRWICRVMDCFDLVLYIIVIVFSRLVFLVDINGLMKYKIIFLVFIGNILFLILNLVFFVYNKWKGFVVFLVCLICDFWFYDFYLLDVLCLWDINVWFVKLVVIYISILILNLFNKYVKFIILIGIYIKYFL